MDLLSVGMLPREDFFLNIEVKSINLVHFESKIKRSMATSLNTHMKQNCKQIFLYGYFTNHFFYNYNDHINVCLVNNCLH